MPYTKSNYPQTMKNLDNLVRIKAIDILNAMLKNEYKEENAIPIAISQAKDWVKDASKKELEKLSDKNITKHQKDSNAARLQDANVKVFYNNEKRQWAVKSVGAKEVSSYHKSKKEAVKKAKEIADNRNSKVIKHHKNE